MSIFAEQGLYSAQPLTAKHLCALLFLSMAVWFITPSIAIEQGMGDSDRYFAIASTPFEFTASPWGYRILIPWIARGISEVSPLSIEQSFFWLQFAFYFSANLLLLQVGRDLKASPILIGASILTFAAGYQFIYYRFNFIHVGIGELSLLGWLCWWFYTREYRWLAIGLAISVLVHESVAYVFLQVMVLYWVFQWFLSRQTDMSFAHLVGLCALPIVIFLAIRLAISAPGQGATDSYLSGYDATFFSKLFGPHFYRRLIEYFTTFGVLLLVVLTSLSRCLKDDFIRLQLFVFVACVTQLLLGLDTKRMASMGILAVLLLAMRIGVLERYRKPVLIALGLQSLYGLFWLNQLHIAAVIILAISLTGAVGIFISRWQQKISAKN